MLFIIVKTYKLLSGCTCHVCHRGLPFAVCYTLFLIYVNSVKVNFGHLACIVHAVSLVSTICGWKTWILSSFLTSQAAGSKLLNITDVTG